MDNNKPGMPGMGLQMPGGEAPQDPEARLADLEARVQALEDQLKAPEASEVTEIPAI